MVCNATDGALRGDLAHSRVLIWLITDIRQLLDFNDDRGWIMHSCGAFIVLQALGPQSIVTETQKDIFIMQVELMVCVTFPYQ